MENINTKIDNFFSQNDLYRKFLEENGIDTEEYVQNLKDYQHNGLRCFRIRDPKVKSIIQGSPNKVIQHPVFDDLVLLRRSVLASTLEGFKEGKITGIEASSSFVVKAMNLGPEDKVIDLCCSPGAKLLEIADRVGPKGLVVGNDLSKERLQICNNFLEKHQICNTVLLNEDATTLTYSDTLFDKVLCDVECSHDGSLKHILKFIEKCGEKKSKKIKISEDEKRALIIKDKSISNKERKRRLV